MLKKSCQWWLIWYLLYICHGAEGQLQWVVKEKVTAYGQNLVLFCPVGNCCSEPAGWFVGPKSIILDVKTFSNDPKVKYHGTHNKDGFGVVIRNLSEADLNVTYRCVYGFNVSTPKYLFHGDVFREYVPDKDKEIDTAAIAVPIVFIMGGVIGIMACCVYRIKKKRKTQRGTDKEKEALYRSDIQIENQEDEADSLSKEGNNFVRLYLCQEITTQAVRFFFDRKVPIHTLKSFLKNNKSNLTDEKSLYKCTREQEAKLFPVGQVFICSKDFDFTLLYKLIRNLLISIPAPTRGWGNPPLPEDQNETDDIERILHVRNFLENNSEFKICDADFSTHWTDLSQAIDRLSKGRLSTDVDKCIKNEKEEDMRKGLKELREELMELRQDMTECKTDIADCKQEIPNGNSKHIPPNIRKGHVESIEKWKIEDTLFYDETRGFTAALEMVESKNYMTIIGGPGSGKTATARHIALQLEKKGWEVVPVCRLEQIIQFRDRDYRQVFVRDDVFGIFAVHNNFYNDISDLKEPICNALGGISKLLLTSRKSVYREVSKLELFVTENIVDLESKANQLTDKEKKKIFQHHCKSEGLNLDLYTSLSFTNANHMFPFLCQIFSRDEKYQQLGQIFFNKPFKHFEKELGKLKKTNTIQYAVLVLCLVNEGKLSGEYLPPKHMKDEVFNNCGIVLSTPDQNIKDAIYHQSETYLTKLKTEYTFRHDFIFEAIAYHYGLQNKRQILKYLSSSYIANKVSVYDQAANEDLCIHISKEMYLALAERLYKDIKSMNLFDVFINKALKHGPFLDVFETMLKTKPFNEFESLILMKRKNICQFVHTTFSVKRRLEMIDDDIEYDRLHLLFDGIFHVEYDIECSVKVISWIINYGHTHLLQEIVNHVECNKHSISLVFGSNIMENGRMLSLGCYSNTLDMVELILKYVDPKCIHIEFTSTCASWMNARTVKIHVIPLIVACSRGNLPIVNALLKRNPDINICNGSKESPLFIVSKHGKMDIVKCLITSGADINLLSNFGQSPLFVASLKGYCDVVEYLLTSRADINLCDENRQSPLFVASKRGHCEIVNRLLNFGADINLCDENRQSPLFVASKRRHCKIVNCLLNFGAEINLCDDDGQSPLHVASKERHYDILKCLLNYGANMNLRNNIRKSPLFVASEEGHCDIVKCLLNAGANVNLCNNSGKSPLFAASEEGHLDIFKCLLSSRADINLCDDDGHSSLLVASHRGHYDVVNGLLHAGAAINLCGADEQSPLFVASTFGHCDIAKCLLNYGADINLCSNIRESALCVASHKGHGDIVKCLLRFGAHVNLRETFLGETPLFQASYQGHYDIVKCLLQSAAEINLCDNDGQSPLFAASMYSRYDVVKYLLSSGADIKLSNKRGQSSLFVASRYGRCDIVKCLLSSGADTNLCEENRRSPLFVASQRGDCDIVECLLSSGADINLCDESRQSPLFVASLNGHCAVVTCLLSSGADINLCDEGRQSPLFVASLNGHCDIVECLLSSGADTNLCDEGRQSPLFVASQRGNCAVVTCLLKSGADINLCDEGRQSPLFVASLNGHCDIVECLLSSGADTNLCDKGRQSPLFVASLNGHFDIVECLLSSDADINLCDESRQSPLFVASLNGHFDIVECLLSSDADINLCDESRQSPLFVAALNGHCAVVTCLLKSGADINLCHERG